MIADAALSELSDLDSCRNSMVNRIEAGTLQVPVLPQAAAEVLSLTADPNAELGELSELIHRDPALASHVLRIANSAAYAGSTAIVSLQQALSRLGMSLLAQIAISVSMNDQVFQVASFEDDVKAVWRHALASGIYGKEVARMKRHNVEAQFLCGLLHTVGKPVAYKAIADWEKEQTKELPMGMVRGMVDQFHCVIGRMISEKWNLPAQVQICCMCYRFYAEAPSFQIETAMTYLSNRLASWITQTEPPEEGAIETDPVFAVLNLYPDDVEALLAKKESVLAEVSAMDL